MHIFPAIMQGIRTVDRRHECRQPRSAGVLFPRSGISETRPDTGSRNGLSQRRLELESKDSINITTWAARWSACKDPTRQLLESYRVQARMAAFAESEKLRKARYEAIQREEARVLQEQAAESAEAAANPPAETVPAPAAETTPAEPGANATANPEAPAAEEKKSAGHGQGVRRRIDGEKSPRSKSNRKRKAPRRGRSIRSKRRRRENGSWSHAGGQKRYSRRVGKISEQGNHRRRRKGGCNTSTQSLESNRRKSRPQQYQSRGTGRSIRQLIIPHNRHNRTLGRGLFSMPYLRVRMMHYSYF